MSQVLIIDDDSNVSELLAMVADRMGHTAEAAGNAHDGLAAALSGRFDVVLLDVGLPDGDGLQILPQLRQPANPPEVIIITGDGDPDAAELAIKNGAWDYLVKPASVEKIQQTIQRALTYHHEKVANPLPKALKRDDIVGNSTVFNEVLDRIAQAAAVESNVLICGETGTGKELLARAIHDNSARANHRFVVVDCAALPESLVESVLFGHAKGAFTSAEREREGLIRQAHGGTLFLDEVGELPLSTQKAFLRVIQERRFRPLSGKEEIQVNFRLVAATNRDLDQMATQGRFRSDLLYRLRSFSIEAPTLRQRFGDIKRLSVYYIDRLCEIYGSELKGLSKDFLEALQQYHWPGNVRELFHTLEEALCLAGHEPTLFPHHLPIRLRAILTGLTVRARTDSGGHWQRPEDEGFMDITSFRNLMERDYLERLTRLTRGNRKEACRISGLSRTRLFELMKKHDLIPDAARRRLRADLPGNPSGCQAPSC